MIELKRFDELPVDIYMYYSKNRMLKDATNAGYVPKDGGIGKYIVYFDTTCDVWVPDSNQGWMYSTFKAVFPNIPGEDVVASGQNRSLVPTTDLQATDLGEVKVRKGSVSELGGCNFCRRDGYRVVFQIEGNQTSVRACAKCAAMIRKGLLSR